MIKNLILPFFIIASSLTSYAQIPESAENISPLLIGESVPQAALVGIGSSETLTEKIAQKPTVMLVYRGGWCPYCNRHLAAVGSEAEQILSMGYQIVGISPDAPEQLKQTTEKSSLSYSLYSDASGKFIKSMGIAFKAPERYGDMLSKFSGGKNEGFLPVPSLFVVDTDGTILFEYISPNYKQRMSPELLISVLKALKQS